jgi:glycosyltransferase involved in cell wall biosynthesis
MLSIVIPTFNEEEYLPRLLDSIKNQTYRDYEVIVADNFSEDQTRAIAESFGALVVAGGNHPGKGRNRGAEVAKGDVLLFLDADVVLEPETWLAEKMEEFMRRKLDIASCAMKPLGGGVLDRFSHSTYNLYMRATQFILEHGGGFCLFARREAYDRVHGFDESINLAEDHDFVRRIAKFGKFRVLKGPGISVSVRRFERDGRFNTFIKYLAVEAHSLVKGTVKVDLNYTWGHPKGLEKGPEKDGKQDGS